MLDEPEAGLTVNHEASDDTDHDAFAVTDTAVDPTAADGTDHDDTFTVNDGVTPGWVTDTVRVTCGEPLVVMKVTVALRDANPAFA